MADQDSALAIVPTPESAIALWPNRIVGYGEVAPAELIANPLNFRLHPIHQELALAGVLNDVGVVQSIVVNRRSGYIVDGHLRVTLAMRDGQPTIPVTWVDLSDDEEHLIMALLDPLAAFAITDSTKLAELLAITRSSNDDTQALLQMIAEREGITALALLSAHDQWTGMPDFENDGLKPFQQLLVTFDSQEHIDQFSTLIGQPLTATTKSIWYPEHKRERLLDLAYSSESSQHES